MAAETELLQRLRAALADADLAVDGLVAEAWQAARDEVRLVLQRAFQHELLERVADAVGGDAGPTTATGAQPRVGDRPNGPEPAPAQDRPAAGLQDLRHHGSRERPADAPSDERGTYVFGVTRTTRDLDPDLPRFVGGGAVRTVDEADLRAVVCDVDVAAFRSVFDLGPDDLDRLAAAANTHDQVLARVAATGPVLPLGLGTVVADDDVVRALLRTNATAVTNELARVEGHAEWAVVVRATAPASDSDVTRADGTGYLRQRQAALNEREQRWSARERLAEDVHRRLAAHAVEAKTVDKRPLEQVPPALHGVYLLRFDGIAAFEGAVEEARAAHPDAIIEATGPWPPYHFTTIEVTMNDGGR